MIKHFELNKKGRDFVVGDVHGCFQQLNAELIRINFNSEIDRLFSVGDLVDRGSASKFALDWLSNDWFHAVRGNHEQMAIDIFNGNWNTDNYIANGGDWFLSLTKEEQQDFVHVFENLPFVIDIETKNGLVGILHADCPVDDWNILEAKLTGERADLFINSCLWDRFRIHNNVFSMVSNIHKIYVGHAPVDNPTMLGNIMYIDTGVVFGGKLTVMEI